MGGSAVKWVVSGGVAALLALAALIVAVRSNAPPAALQVTLPDAPAADGVVKVYITGAVARPGLYELRGGDRYADALAAAGGPAEDAEPLAVNMARRVRDEDHIHVPRVGEGAAVAVLGQPARLDLNTATVAQLEALPGVGPVRAQKIVESRTKEGAFRSADELAQRKLLPASMLEALRELVQVRE